MREWYRRTSAERGAPATGHRDPATTRRNDRKRWGTPRRRASLRAASARQHVKNKANGKQAARTAVNHAVRSGKLPKQPCETCGTWLVQAHHHKGYEPEHWLDVRWLCVAHHKQVHGHLRADYETAA